LYLQLTLLARLPENFKLPTEGSKTISVPFGISFGNDSFHPRTLGFNCYLFFENPYLMMAIPAEVKIGKRAEIFVRADPLKPFIERESKTLHQRQACLMFGQIRTRRSQPMAK
jgi:hypothetical protein